MADQAPPRRPYADCDRILGGPGSPYEIVPAVIFGRKVRIYKHAPLTFRAFIDEVFAQYAERDLASCPLPEPSPFYAREVVTYRDVYERALILAAWLREQGVGVGTRVAIGGVNGVGWLVSFVAVCLLGAVGVTVNSSLHIDANVHCLALTKPLISLVDFQLAQDLSPLRETLTQKGVGRIVCWSSIISLPDSVRANLEDTTSINPAPAIVASVREGMGLEGLGPESDGLIMFTSGTTSLPKGVVQTQRQCVQHPIMAASLVVRAALRYGAPFEMALELAKPTEQQAVSLFAVPLFHVTGLIAMLLGMLQKGSKVVFMRRWSVPDAVKLIVDEKVTTLSGVPAITTSILQSPDLPKNVTFDALLWGGAPSPPRLIHDVSKRFPNAAVNHAFGMTELVGVHCSIAGPDYVERSESVGLAIPIGEIRIVDPKTRKVLPPKTMGILECFGSNVLREYVDNEKATRESIDAEGWLHTGDLGYMDEEGFLYLRDRAKDIIIRGGENIASAEVENVICQDDRIAEAAAVPVPDDTLGELVGVVVSLAPGATATPESIIRQAADKLRYAARPVIVVIVPLLPRNANGKILKTDLRDTIAEAWKKTGGRKKRPKAKL